MNKSLEPVTVIDSKKKLSITSFSELYRYRDLLYFMVLRDITVLYKQSVLGFAWAIINPLVSMVIFSIVFGKLAKVPSDGIPYPIFSYAALIPWTYFSGTLNASSSSLITNSSVFTKVYFPRIIIPLTPVLSKMVDMLISLIMLFVLMLIFGIAPSYKLLLLPLLIFILALATAGLGSFFSSLAIQYRDVKFGLTFFIPLLMYAAPVVFPASLILENFGRTAYLAYALYPVTGVIEGFRAAIVFDKPIPWDLIMISSAGAMVLFVFGLYTFRRLEDWFADVA
jgi:lipopolysaccharide transport system permease protein